MRRASGHIERSQRSRLNLRETWSDVGFGVFFFLEAGTEANPWSYFDGCQHDHDMIYGLVCWGPSVITKCFSDQSCL